MQGSAAIRDMVQSSQVAEVGAADLDVEKAHRIISNLKSGKVKARQVDAANNRDLVELMRSGFDVVACLLPARLNLDVAKAAVKAQVSMVDVSHPGAISGLDNAAREARVSILPACGLDPGIDLVLYGYGCSKLDKVHEIHSYCGGIPQREYADGPLRYKISWTWEGVLESYARKAKILHEGKEIEVQNIMEDYVKRVTFPEPVGEAECFLNGDATVYRETLGLKHVREMTRWTVRWPGHCELWSKLLRMNLLGDEPLEVPEGTYITPRQFMIRHMAPQLQYKKGEGDLVVLRVELVGEMRGDHRRIVFDLVDLCDPKTGVSAMARTTGYTCSIVAQMVGSGMIAEKGVLLPERNVPFETFFHELANRGILITETTTGRRVLR